MKVTCSRCGTEYHFDDARVTEEGVKVKCTRCDNVFRVRKKAYAITEPVAPGGDAPAVSPAAVPADDHSPPTYTGATLRQWMIRRVTGEALEFREMTTLQRWIVERKVGPDDEISHNGVKWKRLGAIPDLAPFFKVVSDEDDQARRTGGDPRTTTGEFLRAQAAPDPADRTAPRPPSSGTPGTERSAAAPRAIDGWEDDRPTNRAGGAAPAGGGRERPSDPTTSDRAAVRPPPPRGGRRGVVLLGIVTVFAAGGWWAQFTPSGLAATAPARAWLSANAGIDLGGGQAPDPTPEATPASTTIAVITPETEETPVAPVSPIATATPEVAATEAATPATPVPVVSPLPARVARPLDTDKLLQLGFEAYSRGRYREAIRHYQAAVNAAPENSEAYALLGLAYLDSGDDDLAESSLEAAIRLNPRFADAHRYLGMLYSRRGDKAHAITSFNTYLDLRPNGPTSDDVRRRVASLQGG